MEPKKKRCLLPEAKIILKTLWETLSSQVYSDAIFPTVPCIITRYLLLSKSPFYIFIREEIPNEETENDLLNKIDV